MGQEKSRISLVTTQLQVGADRLLEVLLLVHHRVTVLVEGRVEHFMGIGPHVLCHVVTACNHGEAQKHV